MSIPVIDIFAGPGGLSEGFSAFRNAEAEAPFKVRLSIEKDAVAHQTLLLRAFFRQFAPAVVPQAYYDFLRNNSESLVDRLKTLFDSHPDEAARARAEARHAELGVEKTETVRQWIDASLDQTDRWVLLGGPPC